MPINKVVYGGETKIDLTDTTATASDVAAGEVFYDVGGNRTVGTGNYMNKVSNPTANDILVTDANGQAIDSGVQLSAKQDTLVSGTNIKTVNGNSLLGSGDVPIVTHTGTEGAGYNTVVWNASDGDTAYITGDCDNMSGLALVLGGVEWALAQTSDIPTVDQTYDGTSTNAQSGTAVASAISTKADLVPSAVANEVLITDANGQPQSSGTDLTTLLNDVEAGKEAFMLKDFNQQINITLPAVTTDMANTSIPNMDVDLDVIDPTGALNQKYAIAGLVKYEIYDATSGGNRLNAFPVCSFSMNGQRTLRIRAMVAGTTSKTARRIQGALLLKHR